MNIKVHEDTFGITQKALKALRDELAARIDHYIEVWEIPSGEYYTFKQAQDSQCYGVVIIDQTVEEAVIIGDGFRGDGGGEGGAGHRAARALLSIFGFSMPYVYYELMEFSEGKDWRDLIEDLAGAAEDSQSRDRWKTTRFRSLHYIDHVVCVNTG